MMNQHSPNPRRDGPLATTASDLLVSLESSDEEDDAPARNGGGGGGMRGPMPYGGQQVCAVFCSTYRLIYDVSIGARESSMAHGWTARVEVEIE